MKFIRTIFFVLMWYFIPFALLLFPKESYSTSFLKEKPFQEVQNKKKYCTTNSKQYQDLEIISKSSLLPPEIRCVSVDETTGDITLTWIPVVNTSGNFNSYHIYSSTNKNGPYTHIDSIFDINTTTYTHVGANAQSSRIYYYMRTRENISSNPFSNPGDTVSSIFMNVTNPGAAFGIAKLNWNHIHDPFHPSSSGIYRIYMKVAKSGSVVIPWFEINSVKDTFYVDTVSLCDAELFYKVEIDDTLGFDTTGNPILCTSISSWDNDMFMDNTPPHTPVIDSVTVNSNNNMPFISWDKNTSPDTEGYIIYCYISGVWTPIDTIWGIDSTSYFDMLNDPCISYQTYRVAAFDSCMNISTMSPEQNTIKANIAPEVCDDKIIISWNPYLNMDTSLGNYKIYYNENGGPFSYLGSVSATNTSYEHVGLTNGTLYCFYIVAYTGHGNTTSTSCQECQTIFKPRQPQFIYLRSASVMDNNEQVRLKIHCDTSGVVTENRIFRADNPSGPFSLVTSLPQPTTSPLLEYIDGSAGVTKKSYYYKVTVIDSCGNEILESNIARTIFLQASANDDLSNEITWNDYEGWSAPVSGTPVNYYLYRKIDNVFTPVTPIATFTSGQGSYTDYIEIYGNSQGKFQYVITAVEGSGNQYNFTDTAQSNLASTRQKPGIFIPNAFKPNSSLPENTIFKPFGVFVNTEGYFLKIYNRWGKMIFETNDFNSGWDGTCNGNDAQAGVYIYHIHYIDFYGEDVDEKGHVTLLR
jgi:gliding motility-associated-like protein